MKSTSTKTVLQIVTGILAVLHLAFIVNRVYQGSLSFLNLVDITYFVLLLIFISGFVLSWKSVKLAGILLMIWIVVVWILDLHLIGDRSDADSGLTSLALSPVLVLGALFLLEWYKTSRSEVPSAQLQWRFILRILLINYAVLYLILVLAELSGKTGPQQVISLSFPFILNPVLLVVFIAGFILSWKREFHAGIIFLIWCAILVYLSFGFPGTHYTGPWLFCGLPILLQGIFYIKYHFEFRSK